MPIPIPGHGRAWLTALALTAGALLAPPGAAAQQCTEEPCGPLDSTPPEVSFSPGTGTYPAGSLGVTVYFFDNYVLNHGTRQIVYNGTDVTGSFTYVQTNNWTTRATGTITVAPGSRVLTASICDGSASANCASASATYAAPAPSVRVSAAAPLLSVPAMSWGTGRFRVVNTGTATTQYNLSGGCTTGFSSCGPALSTVTLAPGDSAWVDAHFTTGFMGGQMSLTATAGTVSSTAMIGINTLTAPDPGYPGDAQSLERIERSVCVSVGLEDGTASECGDLRVVHPLPGARVLNRGRAPVLTYVSDHARPHPVVAAQFTGPDGTAVDSVEAVLLVNGAEVVRQRWPGWGPAQRLRIALSFDASSYLTGLYPYTLQVTAKRAGGARETLPATRSGRMIIVNRSGSPFGAGWWLAGVERLVLDVPGDTLKLWVGGDGSARLYRGNPGGPWSADAYDRPEVLARGPGGVGYVRTLPGGARVRFDDAGLHVATETSVGHTTRFRWSTAGTETRLDTLTLPAPSGQADTLRYAFEYGTVGPGCTTSTTGLSRVRAPAPAGGFRDVWMCGDNLRRVTRIRDATPDTSSVSFGYVSGQRWMNRRANRNNVAHALGYLYVRFHTSVLTLSPGVTATTRVGASQTRGMNGTSTHADSVYVIYDGPVTAVCDCRFWTVDRLGAPTSLRDVYGQLTTVKRGDRRWPGLVTESVAPNGFKTTFTYDTLGNPASSTGWNPYGDNRHATTSVRWNPAAAAPDTVVGPEGEVTVYGYDAYGRRTRQQTGTSALRTVQFLYNPLTHTVAPGLLERIVYADGSAERMEYNARGNLSAVVTPMGARSEWETDRLGRDTVRLTAIDTVAGALRFQGDSTAYDSRGRVERVASWGPSLHGEGAQRMVVVNEYDAESRLLALSRSAWPDPEFVGTITTRWAYDLGGRRILEIAPDKTPTSLLDNPRDSTVYDIAGNATHVYTRRYTDTGQRVVVEMQYDWMNRLTHRILPEVRYDSIGQGLAQRWFIYPWENMRIEALFPNRRRALPYPWYANAAGWGYRIPADTARYEYDAMGRLLRADNRDAWVRRTWFPGGALSGETLKIRTVAELAAGGDSTSHVYPLQFSYDRSGRRTELLHPDTAAPRVGGISRNRTHYTYRPGTGELATVTDPLENVFRYHHNLLGQLDSVSLPGLITDLYQYDLDGRLTRHRTRNGDTGDPARYTQTWLRDERFRYDARGKVLFAANAAGALDSTSVRYSGLGHMLLDTVRSRGASMGGAVPSSTVTEEVVYDALGNRRGMLGGSTFALAGRKSFSPSMELSSYEPGTGRLLDTQDGWGSDVRRYDGGGNTLFGTTIPMGSPAAAAPLRDQAYFYGGDGRLRAADTRVVDNRTLEHSAYRRSFEEYRYDALGRRVWVRARRECDNGPGGTYAAYCEMGWVRRTVWDGDRELYEIQAPSSEMTYDSVRMEVDGGYLNLTIRGANPSDGQDVDPNPFYGRVLYTYGTAVDQPLSVIRMGYGDLRDEGVTVGSGSYRTVAPFAIVPLWNSRGQPALGTFADGRWRHCAGARCVKLTWPELYAGYARPRMFRDFWHGTLLQDKADASGLNYRRNRYYDPATGLFTQEDPIGLAGGLNLYGFGSGDPVGNADPFGLTVCARTPGLQRAIERAFNVTIEWGPDGCVSDPKKVTRLGGSEWGVLQERFLEMVAATQVFIVSWGTTGSGSRFGPMNQPRWWVRMRRGGRYRVFIDQSQIGGPYPSRQGQAGYCGYGPNGQWTLESLIVHELLGHGYGVVDGRVGFPSHQGTAIETENMYYSATPGREPMRCGDHSPEWAQEHWGNSRFDH